jgi:hypothetical protein
MLIIIILLILILVPSFLIVFAYSRITSGFLNSPNINKEDIVIGSITLAVVCIGSIVVELLGGELLAIGSLFPSAMTAIVAGVWLGKKLYPKMLYTGLIMGFGFPIFLVLITLVGKNLSPNVILHRNGEQIAAALEKYHADKGKYPATLEELEPVYISEIIQPKSIWGWLYTIDGDNFAIGYVNYVDSFGYGTCFISNKNKEWNCSHDYLKPSPFKLQPTPTGFP